MAALTASANTEARNTVTVTGSGLSNSTDYNLVITNADGSSTTRRVTTDGSGGFTFKWVSQSAGKQTFRLDSLPTTVVTTISGSERRS